MDIIYEKYKNEVIRMDTLKKSKEELDKMASIMTGKTIVVQFLFVLFALYFLANYYSDLLDQGHAPDISYSKNWWFYWVMAFGVFAMFVTGAAMPNSNVVSKGLLEKKEEATVLTPGDWVFISQIAVFLLFITFFITSSINDKNASKSQLIGGHIFKYLILYSVIAAIMAIVIVLFRDMINQRYFQAVEYFNTFTVQMNKTKANADISDLIYPIDKNQIIKIEDIENANIEVDVINRITEVYKKYHTGDDGPENLKNISKLSNKEKQSLIDYAKGYKEPLDNMKVIMGKQSNKFLSNNMYTNELKHIFAMFYHGSEYIKGGVEKYKPVTDFSEINIKQYLKHEPIKFISKNWDGMTLLSESSFSDTTATFSIHYWSDGEITIYTNDGKNFMASDIFNEFKNEEKSMSSITKGFYFGVIDNKIMSKTYEELNNDDYILNISRELNPNTDQYELNVSLYNIGLVKNNNFHNVKFLNKINITNETVSGVIAKMDIITLWHIKQNETTSFKILHQIEKSSLQRVYNENDNFKDINPILAVTKGESHDITKHTPEQFNKFREEMYEEIDLFSKYLLIRPLKDIDLQMIENNEFGDIKHSKFVHQYFMYEMEEIIKKYKTGGVEILRDLTHMSNADVVKGFSHEFDTVNDNEGYNKDRVVKNYRKLLFNLSEVIMAENKGYECDSSGPMFEMGTTNKYMNAAVFKQLMYKKNAEYFFSKACECDRMLKVFNRVERLADSEVIKVYSGASFVNTVMMIFWIIVLAVALFTVGHDLKKQKGSNFMSKLTKT
jgi:hypothetical protein